MLTFDVAIVGAGIIGLSTAYHLSAAGLKLVIIEKDYLGSGSTLRCIGGIRQQFSTPTSIRVMKDSLTLFQQMEEEFGFPVEFHQGGYLLLAHTPQMVEVFQNNIKIQQAEGVNVTLLSPKEAQEIVPDLNTEGLLAAAYCPDDGQAYPFAVLKGYHQKLQEKKQTFFLHNPVKKIKINGNFRLTLGDGTTLEAKKVLLSAGPWTGELAKLVGLDLPLYPERHEAIVTERLPKFIEPMLVDYRPDGCYFHQLISGHIIGCYTPIPNVPGIRIDSSLGFLQEMGQRMVRLVPPLEKATILRQWAGCYTMTPDGSPIVDESPIKNLYIAAGMSGHGFMFGPGIGKHLAHFIAEEKWDVDFKEFAINRSFKGKESLK